MMHLYTSANKIFHLPFSSKPKQFYKVQTEIVIVIILFIKFLLVYYAKLVKRGLDMSTKFICFLLNVDYLFMHMFTLNNFKRPQF